MAVGSGYVGRDIALTMGGSSIAGLRTKGVAMNKEAIDVTNDADSGWRTMLNKAGTTSLDLSLSGVTENLDVLYSAFQTNSIYACVLTYPDGSTVSGDFFLASINQTGEYNGAQTFDITLNSSGAVTFTPGV